ncbi:MAG: TolC family protein, partial [Thermodesulfobacteriota bacterium]
MKKILVLVVILGIGTLISNASSQEMLGNKALTLEECIQLALKNRPELEMATLDILNAEYQIKEANSYYYP